MRQAYLNLIEKQREELNNFPIAYAFSKEQLKEALEKLGAKNVTECCTYSNMGDIMKKEDAPRYKEMLERHTDELRTAMMNEDFAEAAFLYEMDNHEYAINWDGDADVLSSLCMNKKILKELGLENAYKRARRQHMINAQEWGVI